MAPVKKDVVLHNTIIFEQKKKEKRQTSQRHPSRRKKNEKKNDQKDVKNEMNLGLGSTFD